MPIPVQMKINLSNGLLVRGGTYTSERSREASNEGGANNMSMCEMFARILAQNGWPAAESAGAPLVASVVESLLAKKNHSALGNAIVDIGDVSDIIVDIAARAFEVGFTNAKTSFQAISKVTTVSRSRSNELRSLTTGSDVEEIPEGQPPKLGQLSPVLDALTLKKYGRALLLTMESILNDRLDILTSAPVALGASLKRKLNSLTWRYLLGNPTTNEDSTAVFTAGHRNLMAPGALTAVTLASAYDMMLNFLTGADSSLPGAIVPKYLCVPPALYLTALNLTGANQSGAEVIGPKLTVLVEPEIGLTLGNAAWLLAADVDELLHTRAVFLPGGVKPSVTVRSGQSAEAKGTFIDICQYYAPLVQNFRGWILNAGA